MKVPDIVNYYVSVPINLTELAKYFPKVKTKKDLKYVIYCLQETAGQLERALDLVNKDED